MIHSFLTKILEEKRKQSAKSKELMLSKLLRVRIKLKKNFGNDNCSVENFEWVPPYRHRKGLKFLVVLL